MKQILLSFIFLTYCSVLHGQRSGYLVTVEQVLKMHFDDQPLEFKPNWQFWLGHEWGSNCRIQLGYSNYSNHSHKIEGRIGELRRRDEKQISVHIGRYRSIGGKIGITGSLGIAYLTQTRWLSFSSSPQSNLYLGYFGLDERKGFIGLPIELNLQYQLAPTLYFNCRVGYMHIFKDYFDSYLSTSTKYRNQVNAGIGLTYCLASKLRGKE